MNELLRGGAKWPEKRRKKVYRGLSNAFHFNYDNNGGKCVQITVSYVFITFRGRDIRKL